ncbi:MAG: hypothetical protein JWL59_4858 [Chthoniobacteraceae bacterium]|nr:hypothetical protein [Chthoniobacteraceae bacterium]
MNPRKFLNFCGTKPGIFIVGLLILAIGLLIANTQRKRVTPRDGFQAKPGTAEEKPQLLETVTRAMVPFRPPGDEPAKATPIAQKKPTQAPIVKPPPLTLVAETVVTKPKPKERSADFAPFGRLIPCKLIVTVDSSTINTPIIGLVTGDVYHHGRLLIPAGTEVHGTAQIDRVRERIASNRRWILVWQTGEELHVSGLALDREHDQNGEDWGITDGSAGLRGRLIERDDYAEIKLFAATLLSGATEALTEKRSFAFGTYALPSLQNAPLQGAQAVLDRYAQQIEQTIERDGFYVRVAAGKQFYLYITQPIDRADAKVAGVAIGTEPAGKSASSQDEAALNSISLRNSRIAEEHASQQ